MIQALLKGKNDCACGRAHTCEIESVVIGRGAVKALGDLCKPYANILLVADENTYATCGDTVVELLGTKLGAKVIFPGDTLLIPDEAAIARVNSVMTKETDLVLGIGSGVINDLCKCVSFQNGLRYFIVATAPSMDGYASVGAAMILDKMKKTLDARMPAAIIGDVDVLKNAPMRMIQSGFGDIIGKYSALNDWKLAHCVNGEYFCKEIYQLVYDTVLKTEALADGIQTRNEEAIQTLMEALVIVGIAMSFVGNSRPASGSEHHLSHYYEIVGILNNEEYFLHGIDVAYSTVVTQKLREELLALGEVRSAYSHDAAAWEGEIKKRYGAAADGVIALQNKCGYYEKDYETIYRENWDEIRKILSEVPSSAEILDLLKIAGLDYSEFEALYSAQKIQDSIWYAKDLKDRYTVLWLYFLLCNK